MAPKPNHARYIAVILLILVSACSTAALQPTPEATIVSPGVSITIGDISDEPKKKIDRFQPLADYLAANLSDFGIGSGRVLIASSVDDMIDMVEHGEVDIYFDSPFPALTTQANAGTELILRRWKDGEAMYRGVIVTGLISDVRTTADLRGRIVAAEEPYSTTGYAAQAIGLAMDGFELVVTADLDSPVPTNVVGVWFSRDEENTIEAVTSGRVQAGFLSDQDLADLPNELRSQIRVLSQSEPLPRQVVSIRGDLDELVAEQIRKLLVGLETSDGGLAILEQIETARFDEIPFRDRRRLDGLASTLDFLP